jgi:hypothetical protein
MAEAGGGAAMSESGFSRLIGFLKTLVEDRSITYDLSDPRLLEEAIVADARAGKLRFRMDTEHNTMVESTFYHGVNCSIDVQVDRPFRRPKAGYSYSYIRIQEKEFDYQTDFNHERVIAAIIESHDKNASRR